MTRYVNEEWLGMARVALCGLVTSKRPGMDRAGTDGLVGLGKDRRGRYR
jgi:hypothetical protein